MVRVTVRFSVTVPSSDEAEQEANEKKAPTIAPANNSEGIAMFLPSARNWEEMKYEAAGCWPLPINDGTEYAMVTKMPASVIKAAYRSCPMSLTVARAHTSDGIVLAAILTIADDPAAALMLSGILRHEEEHVAIDNILRTGSTLMVFFDELSRPLARAHCALGASQASDAFQVLAEPGRRYAGPWTALLAEVLDEVQAIADPQLAVPPKHVPKTVTIPLTLSHFETSQTTTVGMADRIDFRLDDPDEGMGLEQSTWHLLENLFGPRLHHSPRVQDGDSFRELTDILAAADSGLCLFEAKAAAILSTELGRTTDRRVKSVQKQIDKGIGQLVGAIKNLAARSSLQTKRGLPLILPAEGRQNKHAIVMISEMLPCLDWEAIAAQLFATSQKSGAMFHVLDLHELRVLVGVSSHEPGRLVAHLVHRFSIMLERKHAMLRTRLDGPTMP